MCMYVYTCARVFAYNNIMLLGLRTLKISIEGVSAPIMSLIVEYAYTRLCEITSDNVEELCVAANFFLIFGLQYACCSFLLKHLDNSNCIGICKFARSYFCTELETAAHKHTMEHFQNAFQVSNLNTFNYVPNYI